MDIELLRRIQELDRGRAQPGGRHARVIELEAEVARLRQEVGQARAEARAAVDQVHRHYRRDLVPLGHEPGTLAIALTVFPGRSRTWPDSLLE